MMVACDTVKHVGVTVFVTVAILVLVACLMATAYSSGKRARP